MAAKRGRTISSFGQAFTPLSVSGGRPAIVGTVALTLQPRSRALTLRSRTLDLALSARSMALTLRDTR